MTDRPAAGGTDPALVEGYCTCLDKPMRDCGISAHRRAAAAGAPNFQVPAPKVGTGQAGSKSFGDPLGEVTADIEPGAAGAGTGALPEALHFEKAQPNAITRAMTGPPRPVSGHAAAVPSGAPDDEALIEALRTMKLYWGESGDGRRELLTTAADRLAAVRADWGGIPDEAVDRAAEVRAECICKYDGQADVRWEPGCPVHNVLLGELAAVRAERDTNDELAREHYEEMCRQEDRADNAEDRIAAVRALCDHAETWSDEVSIDAVRSALGSSTATGEAL